MANKRISELPVGTTATTGTKFEVLQGGINVQIDADDLPGTGLTREFNRTFVETLVFDKNEIFHSPIVMTSDIMLIIGAGGLVDQSSGMRFRITADGIHSISFGTGFDFLYGISNGEILEAGTYEVYLLYTNGSVSVNVPGVTSQGSSAGTLSSPSGFSAVADGVSAIDLSWLNVTNNEGYLIEFSLTGTGGWSTLETTAADATSSTQIGLAEGDIRYYRIKTLGDGINTLDSNFSGVISGQTESSSDVTAPTFIFLPASGNAVWPVNRPVIITANEPIQNTDGSEITNANVASRITLKQTNSGGADISFTATIDGPKQIITIYPTTQYGENQLVYVAINNVEDVNGNEVTVAVSATFTTTDYSYLDGTDDRLQFGDILDSLFSVPLTNFWLEITLNNMLLTGIRPMITKYDPVGNQRSFQWYFTGSDVFFGYVGNNNGNNGRVIKWTGVLTAGEHTLVMKYDGSINTNNGLDRVTLLIDGVIQGSKSMYSTSTTLISSIANCTAQLTIGAYINSSGTPVYSSFYTEEAKDFIVRSTAGSVVEINVPNLKTGLDTSGNSRHGTWV